MAVVEPLITIMDQALLCLSQAVTGSPNPPAQMCFRVGLEVAHDIDQFGDLCCDGLGYVMLGDTWPTSDSFPEMDINRQANTNCAPPGWAQVFRMGIVRCVPSVMDDAGSMPTCADWDAAGYQNAYDSASLRRAVCCFRSWFKAQTDFWLGMSLVIDRQVQGPVAGGCVERSVTMTVQFPNCDCV